MLKEKGELSAKKTLLVRDEPALADEEIRNFLRANWETYHNWAREFYVHVEKDPERFSPTDCGELVGFIAKRKDSELRKFLTVNRAVDPDSDVGWRLCCIIGTLAVENGKGRS
ncbi:hypothetical protein MYX78_01835 [Acidobacteria bacterium AH-259-G07]|nr:hypothetical protein [Acidobacteria bacterium AH-259-G07]